MSGLLNYALEGLKKLVEDGYFKEENYAELKKKWQSIASKIAKYKDKFRVFEKDTSIHTAELNADSAEKVKPALTDAMFGRELKKLGIKKEREPSGKRLNVYKGVRLKDGESTP